MAELDATIDRVRAKAAEEIAKAAEKRKRMRALMPETAAIWDDYVAAGLLELGRREGKSGGCVRLTEGAESLRWGTPVAGNKPPGDLLLVSQFVEALPAIQPSKQIKSGRKW
jgi:hypothetical protein